MEQRRVTPLTTAGCFAAIMLVFALLSTYVPIFSFIGYFIMPIPMVIIFMKYGLRQTLLLGVTVGFLMGLFIDPVTALVQFLSFGAVGLALELAFAMNGRLYASWGRLQRPWSPSSSSSPSCPMLSSTSTSLPR